MYFIALIIHVQKFLNSDLFHTTVLTSFLASTCTLYLVGPSEYGCSMEEVMDTSNQPLHPWLISDSKMTTMM